MESVGPVELRSGQYVGTQIAKVGVSGRTRAAVPTGGDERQDHMVARLNRGDLGADLLDDPSPFMATYHRIRHRKITRHQVVVAVTETGCGKAHPHLMLARRVKVHLLHLELLVLPMKHSCPSFHETPFADLITLISIRASTPGSQVDRRPRCRCAVRHKSTLM